PPTTSIYYHPGLRALHPFPTRRSSDLSRASSGGETRIIRMGYGADELYTRWSQRSLVRWKEFCKATHQKLFLETGVLWMAGKNDARLKDTAATLKRCGVAFEEYDRTALERKYPQIGLEKIQKGMRSEERRVGKSVDVGGGS